MTSGDLKKSKSGSGTRSYDGSSFIYIKKSLKKLGMKLLIKHRPSLEKFLVQSPTRF